MAEPHDVVVYGATGYTGRLICKQLQARGTSFCVAGRDAGKLDRLAESLGGKSTVEPLVAALDDPAALRRMAARGRVVLDCAGPFARYGAPVLEAALAERRHFLDITGELRWMLDTFARDAEARERGVALINGVGFDVVPTDAAAVLASEAAGSPVARVRIAISTQGKPTQGTMFSMVDGAQHGGMAYVDGRHQGEPVGAHRWDVPFPSPMGPRECVSIPWGDLATAPRSTGAANVRTFMAARGAGGMRALGTLLKLSPLRKLAERYVRSLPEGPTDAERARNSCAVYAEAAGPDGARAVWVTAGDGYDFTAHSASLCATLAARPGFTATGALTPTQAFGARALLDGLADRGVRWGMPER